MKYLKYKQSSRMPCVLLTISLMALEGCAEWSSTPARVQADYGNSVRSLVNNQIYNPDKARHPAALLPDGMEGNKADTVLDEGLSPGHRQPERHFPQSVWNSRVFPAVGGSGGSTQ